MPARTGSPSAMTGATTSCFDDANCGACGNACDPGEKCFLGRCGCSNPTNLDCDGQCVDRLAATGTTAGSCGNVCPAGQDCVGGTCQGAVRPVRGAREQTSASRRTARPAIPSATAPASTRKTIRTIAAGAGTSPRTRILSDGVCTPCPNWTGLWTTPGVLPTSAATCIGVCCRPETPQCCFTADHGGGCCSSGQNLL